MSPSNQEGDMLESPGDDKFCEESRDTCITNIQSSSSLNTDDPDYTEAELDTLSEYSPGSSSDLSTSKCLNLVLDYFGDGEPIFPLNPGLNRQQQPKIETQKSVSKIKT